MGVFGSGLDFDSISVQLGVRASHSHRKGDPGLTSRPYPQDLWLLESPLPHTEPIDAHLKWLGWTLSPHYGFLRKLKEGAGVRSYCGFLADDRCAFQVSGGALRLFTELAIDMEISLVFIGPPDADASPEVPGLSHAEIGARDWESESYRTESKVCLQVIGPSLDFGRISRTLSLDAPETYRSGDVDRSGKTYTADVWSVTAPLSKTDEVDAHFRWIRMALLPHSDFLRSVKRGADVILRCDFRTECDTGGARISPEGLELSALVDIPLEFNALLI